METVQYTWLNINYAIQHLSSLGITCITNITSPIKISVPILSPELINQVGILFKATI